jgi:hypothetical protein
MTEVIPSVSENFSLIRGGPFRRVVSLIGPANNARLRVINRALIGVFICWVPLIVPAFSQGLAFGNKVTIPLLKDYAVHLRFLLALPILILAETLIDRRWQSLAQEFLRTGLVGKDTADKYDAAIERISRLADSVLPELAMLLLAYAAPVLCASFWFRRASRRPPSARRVLARQTLSPITLRLPDDRQTAAWT